MLLIRNNAFSKLASGLAPGDVTLTVNSGHGDRFPVVAGGDAALLVLQDAANNIEVVRVTARAGGADSMTVTRAQEGTTARTWQIGDIVELRVTAGLLAPLSVMAGASNEAGIRSALDVAGRAANETINGDRTFSGAVNVTGSLGFNVTLTDAAASDTLVPAATPTPILTALQTYRNNLKSAFAKMAGRLLGSETLLTSGDNLDNITTPGLYRWATSTPTNAPAANCHMEVTSWGDGAQQTIRTSLGEIRYRNKKDSGSAWGAMGYLSVQLPIGSVIAYHGNVGDIPANWSVCDGSNGTPDLRDRMVVGSGNLYSVGATGGSKDAIVVSHTHPASSNSTGWHAHTRGSMEITGGFDAIVYGGDGLVVSGQAGAFQADWDYDGASVVKAAVNSRDYFIRQGTGFAASRTWTGVTSADGGHSHSISVVAQGSSGTDKNMPPYYALVMIRRMW